MLGKRKTDLTMSLNPLTASRELALAMLESSEGARCATLSCHPEIGVVSIGRSPAATIRLNDAYVSRIHAEITWNAERGTHSIADLGTENGTYVDGLRIRRPTPLQDGALLRIGRTTLRYRGPSTRSLGD